MVEESTKILAGNNNVFQVNIQDLSKSKLLSRDPVTNINPTFGVGTVLS